MQGEATKWSHTSLVPRKTVYISDEGKCSRSIEFAYVVPYSQPFEHEACKNNRNRDEHPGDTNADRHVTAVLPGCVNKWGFCTGVLSKRDNSQFSSVA